MNGLRGGLRFTRIDRVEECCKSDFMADMVYSISNFSKSIHSSAHIYDKIVE